MTARAKRLLFWAITGIISLVLMACVLEILAIAALTIHDGKYVPASQRFAQAGNTFIEQVTTGGKACRYVDTLFPHPYLGFVHHGNPPCGIAHINNIGLFGDDFPSEKRQDRFVILLTGGSVAAQFGQMLGPGHPKYLESLLNQRYISPNGKPFLVLNGGDGAWKEPQQLILFLLYADVIDAVITLDGFNEHYMLKASSRFEYPANNFVMVNPLANYSYGQVVAMWLVGKVAGMVSRNYLLEHSHAAYVVVKALVRLARSDTIPGGNRKTTLDSIFALPGNWDELRKRQWATSQYRKYVLALDAVAKDRSILSAHFVQPVPAIGKRLTDEEKGIVGDLQYADLYRKMTDDLLQLRGSGVRIFDLLDLFEAETGTIYGDHIHLKMDANGKSRGYELMATRIASDLAKAWQLRKKQ